MTAAFLCHEVGMCHLCNGVHYFVTENEWTDPKIEVRYCDELED